MTAHARLGHVTGQLNLKRRMGVHMAGHTTFQSEVITLLIVTLAAEWNDPDIFRWVSLMAISAQSLVCLALGRESKHNIFMTLAAVTHTDCGLNVLCVLACLCLKVCDVNTKKTEANKTQCKVEDFSRHRPWITLSP
jgi:hypothetical protein